MPSTNVSQPKKKKATAKAGKKVDKKSGSQKLPLSKGLLTQMHDHMVKARVLEERLIKIYKTGEAYFWIGSPGEEAWGVPLGMLVNKGQGVEHDYLHLHYRGTPTLVAMGMPMIDSIRLIMNKATDRCTGGRNFSNHYCFPEMNVVPVSSPIEIQYSQAIGTAWSQKRNKAKGITIVTGGDAGTAEGDFASCLVWASRRGSELPMLITVQNNKWGISTNYDSQHGEDFIADRGKAFNMRTAVINGNDPVETYLKLSEEMEYIRKTGKPVLLEARVSRLYGHSSASGANKESHEEDCITVFEKNLKKWGVLTDKEIQAVWTQYEEESKQVLAEVRKEADPSGDTVWDHYYANNENGNWRHF